MKRRMIQLLSLLITGLFGCGTAVPVQELESPEVLGPKAGRAALIQGTSPLIAFERTGVKEKSESVTTSYGGIRLQGGVTRRIQLGLDWLRGGSGGSVVVAGKYQWLGEDYFHSQAEEWVASSGLKIISTSGNNYSFTVDKTQYFLENVNGTGAELNTLFGYKFGEAMGFYTGPKIISIALKGDYVQNSNGGFISTEQRTLTGGGVVAGFYASPHSNKMGFDFVIEGYLMNTPGITSSARTWSTGFGVSIGLPINFEELMKPEPVRSTEDRF